MKFNKTSLLSFAFLISKQIIKINAFPSNGEDQLNSFPYGEKEFRLGIIGDSGAEDESREVMELTTYDAILNLGDLDYNCQPDAYFEKVLDSNRKYDFLSVLGNHDAGHECPAEANRFLDNVYNEMTSSKNKNTQCEFSESKFMWSCKYYNMRIIGLTPGVSGADKRDVQLEFLKKHLSSSNEDWKICAWHFYDKYYHTGKYPDDGNIVSGSYESFYDYCKDHGAIIFSAHDHVYARTHVMSQFSEPVIDRFDEETGEDIVQIRKGATIDILNGAGGWEMYIEQGEQKDYKWWQKKYAKGSHGENEKSYGGLFCNFNVGGNKDKARCEFLRINSDEKVFDNFTIYKNENPGTIPYSQIDEKFLYEKTEAFKNGGSSGNGSKISTTKIIIGGSICAALVILGGGILLFTKKNKKYTNTYEPTIKIKLED
ncbi:Metallo-dependent phosphatase [Anaeromyces robustus]|jgi:hypothetical protein|uniref:Metallo-dependent phosphatase n=1 Tax=Anaeromyces robustus TaxID=1754192 RepID=A0A1Y1XFG5_9FUNG|nr:Metallo-dependent phosphatase [Anaeromyces robustus]|eukprot:ORX84498.1 Metallo-dependent phosphatase [Anaeromyces robustus]